MNHEQVMRQALDALLRVQPQIRGAIPQQDVEDAIDNLRRAVAEPVQEPATQPGPGLVMCPDCCAQFDPALNHVEPVQEQDIEDAIEAAYWQFDCRRSGLNEWASAPQSERDAFKAEARKLVRGYFPTRQAQDTKREMLAVADAFIRGKRAALAEPVLEPYCYVYEYDSHYGLHREFYPREYNGMKPTRTVPVYTAPPQRKPLTEDVATELVRSVVSSSPRPIGMVEYGMLVARAIERAHGIGEYIEVVE